MSKQTKSKIIYAISTMRFGFKYMNDRRSADGYYHSYEKRTSSNQKQYFSILRERTWGWYSSLKNAQKCIEENWGDIFEGSYDYALIEEIPEGVLFGGAIPKEWWFKWKGTCKKGKYILSKKPKEYDTVVCFAGRLRPRSTGL